jgi:hypothetical protein
MGLMTTFYCLRFKTPPTWRGRSPYSYPPGTGWPGYTPTHFVPFSSPKTRRAMVEVFDPTTIWSLLHNLGMDHVEATSSNNSSTVVLSFIATYTYLLPLCQQWSHRKHHILCCVLPGTHVYHTIA